MELVSTAVTLANIHHVISSLVQMYEYIMRVMRGWSWSTEMDSELKTYYSCMLDLVVRDGEVLWENRVAIPPTTKS